MGSTNSKPRPPKAVSEQPLEAQFRPPVPKKILLLGTSDSGKSTVLKQIQSISTGEIDSEHRSSWAEAIGQNVRESIQHLISRMEAHGVWFSHQATRDHANTLSCLRPGFLPMHVAEIIRHLWHDTLTQNFVEAHRAEALLYDCSEHFLDKVVEIGRADYWPTDEDILRCRRVSTGISVWHGCMGSTLVDVCDVGGTRSERRKWSKCFDEASVVLFCASLTDYSKALREENQQSRFTDSLAVFEAIINSPNLQNARIMLLLTKSDIFSDQLAEVPLASFCSDFTAKPTTENGIHYIRNRFMDLRHDRDRKINTFVMNATNTDQVKRALSYIPGIVPEKVPDPYDL
ncbi:hypothetical protein D9619_012602 [Psilocybe cf. subviscida]|uniref:Guanine nucleotide binding protein, alpha subunit n=1 Tax=Psilocybe cf. subviscida TaxID=2480587 RepID=A0A8H5B8S6_9AGAR|nr:hypothetical protein D9619_012602 [Psilocybe cf. subviscida]